MANLVTNDPLEVVQSAQSGLQNPAGLVWIPLGTATLALRQCQGGRASVAIQTEQDCVMFKYFLYWQPG
jgi:hypothetical protein